jgi:hypothetical protein
VKNQQQVGHNHEVERHLLDISNFFNKSKTEKLGVQNYSAPLLSEQQTVVIISAKWIFLLLIFRPTLLEKRVLKGLFGSPRRITLFGSM